MSDHQEKARALLAIVEKAPAGPWHWVEPDHDGPWDGIGRASLRTVSERKKFEHSEWLLPDFIVDADEVTVECANAIAALPDLATELRAALDREKALRAEVERLKDALEKIADWRGAWGPFPESNANWRAMAILTAREALPEAQPAQAFTGRITGRNRADIPSDAGVPSRDQWAGYGEGWSVGLAAMANDPERNDIARAIGQEDAKP